MPAAVSAKGVSKKYRIFSGGRDRLKEALSFGRRKYGRDFWALKDINLEVEPGTTLGILGRNGAGKSTLLGIIAGILQPTSGTVEVNGRLVALSGMGAGFNKEFTGRENVILNGLILGMEYREVLERFDDIAAFADIGDFMDQPIKTYSSGMRSRLGFAVAVNVEPDVLILDETLAVGDAVYRETALQKMYELRDSGTTILFVSHSTKMVEDFCTEAILLHKGRMLASGETAGIIDRYQRLISKSKTRKNQRETGDKQPSEANTTVSGEETENLPSGENSDFERRAPRPRAGAREVKIRSVELLDEHLHPVEVVAPDSTVTIRVQLEYLEAVKNSELSVTLHNDAGLEVFSADTAMEGIPLEEMKKGEHAIVDFTFEIPLQHGAYGVTAAARAGGSEDLYLDRVEAAAAFEISRPRDHSPFRGLVHLPVEIKVHTPEGNGRAVPLKALSPRVTVVIPNWNTQRFLGPCLNSLRRQTFEYFETILVDSGSTDDSLSFVAENFPEVRTIALGENRGFSGAVNAGIKASETEYVALLNNDTEQDPRWLEALVRAAEEHPEAGLFTSKQIDFANRLLLDGAGDALRLSGLPYRLGHGEPDLGQYDQATFVFGACAAAALYRRSVLDDVGLFDEDFFAYCEDGDLSFRAQLAGYRCLYAPEAIIYHVGSASTGGKRSATATRLGTRNGLCLLVKNLPAPLVPCYLPFVLAGQLSRLLVTASTSTLRAHLQGLAEALNLMPRMLRKRREIQGRRRVPVEYIGQLLKESSRAAGASLRRRLAYRLGWGS